MKITIHEPWYSAWSKFNWPKPIWGVGIKKDNILDAIKNHEKVYVHLETLREDYWFKPQKIYDYCKQKKWMFLAGKKTLLYVVPKFLLEKEVKDETVTTNQVPF